MSGPNPPNPSDFTGFVSIEGIRTEDGRLSDKNLSSGSVYQIFEDGVATGFKLRMLDGNVFTIEKQ